MSELDTIIEEPTEDIVEETPDIHEACLKPPVLSFSLRGAKDNSYIPTHIRDAYYTKQEIDAMMSELRSWCLSKMEDSNDL